MKYIATVAEKQFTIDIDRNGEVTVDGQVVNADMQDMLDPTLYSIILDGKSHDLRMNEGDGIYEVKLGGEIYEVLVEDERTRRLAGIKGGTGAMSGEFILKSPMPGVVVEVLVTPEQEVSKGDILIVLESMKMQNEFKAPRDGKVHVVRVAKGDKVDQNAVMVTIT